MQTAVGRGQACRFGPTLRRIQYTSQIPFTMKLSSLHYCTALALSSRALYSTAWTCSSRALWSARQVLPASQLSNVSRLAMSTVASTTEEQASVDSSTPTVVSEGPVVARFPGGLSAIRLNDGDKILSDYQPGVTGQTTPDFEARPNALGSAVVSFDLQGRRVTLPDGSSGVVVAHRPPVVFAFSDQPALPKDGLAQVHSDLAQIAMSPSDRVVDFHGRALLEGTASKDAATEVERRPIFAPIPQVKDIALINNPMLSGVTMIDALAPIGKGQNMLMIGHDLDAMRGYVMDCLQTQVRDGGNIKIVYATTQDESTVLVNLKERKIDHAVHVIAPTKTEKDEASMSAEAVAMASSACSVAEMYALEQGMDALVVVDTIDLHKKLWDTTTRVLVDVFGADAVVEADRKGGASSEMRVFFSSLIQRSAQYKENRGGGSVTLLLLTTIPNEATSEDAVFSESDFNGSPEKIKQRIKLLTGRKIPLTAANLRKVDIPIPSDGKRLLALQHVDDLISMSDGQIWLDERMESQGQWPPMNPQRSVTRIGIGADTDSRADAPALRRLDSRFRLDLSQAFNMVGAEETEATRRQMLRKDALLLAMHQMPGSGGRKLSESCVLLLAATTGKLDYIVSAGAKPGSEQGEQWIRKLLDHMSESAAEAMAAIDRTLDMTDHTKELIMAALESYTDSPDMTA